ncbi:hypothetical protein [Natronorubrum sp. DTA28]|uniref:hypothetical protein n=1 Tax=Natronorubrum sp. DTA28 TaxID=3447019 RepID=UPI003F84C9E3
MDSRSNEAETRTARGTTDLGTTRRSVLAAGGAAVLSGLAGCSTIDGLFDRGSEQLVGTRVSSPAAFYAGGSIPDNNSNFTLLSGGDASVSSDADGRAADPSRPRVSRAGEATVRSVPPTLTHQGRLLELEGWAISTGTQANDYNSVRSNKRRSEWWGGPDDHDDDEEGDILADILDIELELLKDVTTGLEAVDRQSQSEATRALDAFLDTTVETLRPALDRCGISVCEPIRESSDGRTKTVEEAADAVEAENWAEAAERLEHVEELVLRDVERLDDELVERRPGRPRFTDIILYLRDEPTIGEQFTVCLPDASLPGDLGSLAEELTPERVLAYFAASHEPDGLRTPFHDRYGSQGVSYDDEGCIQLDGPVSLHRDISCGSILSAELDTYRTTNRGIVGYSTEGGAVVSARTGRNPQTGEEIQTTAEEDEIDGKCVFVAPDGTLREVASLNDGEVQCWGQRRSGDDNSLYCWGSNRAAGDVSASETLVCPVSVTPEDCPCPLPGIFYVRRYIHDEQVIFAGGWILDEGALYEDSATLLFDEGPTEIASVTSEDVESDDYDDRIVEQFSRDRSQQGSAVLSGEFDADTGGIPAGLMTEQGRKGLNAVNVKVAGEISGSGSESDLQPWSAVAALDAPLVHLANAGTTSNDVKFKAGAELSKSVN